MMTNKKDYCVRKAFENMIGEADRLRTYKHQAAYRKENCIKVERFSEKGAAGYREVLDEECYLKRGSASMREDKGKFRYHNHTGGSNRRIVDLKTGKTRQEEEYEKTVRLLKLMKGAL